MKGQLVQWTSSNPTVATVNEQGVVRAVKVGDASITAQVGDRSASVSVHIYHGPCTQASATIEIGQTRGGVLDSYACRVQGEPVDGWQVNVPAATLLQFELKTGLYFGHLMVTDTQLRPVVHTGYLTRTVRSHLPAGSYIIWVGADGDDGPYELTVKAIPPDSEVSPGAASKRAR